MLEKLMITAPAKVNLSLRITGRRDDGYHELESLVAFASCGDTLELAKSSATRLTVVGSSVVSADETNLIIRALRSLEAHTGKPLVTDIRLHKNLISAQTPLMTLLKDWRHSMWRLFLVLMTHSIVRSLLLIL